MDSSLTGMTTKWPLATYRGDHLRGVILQNQATDKSSVTLLGPIFGFLSRFRPTILFTTKLTVNQAV